MKTIIRIEKKLIVFIIVISMLFTIVLSNTGSIIAASDDIIFIENEIVESNGVDYTVTTKYYEDSLVITIPHQLVLEKPDMYGSILDNANLDMNMQPRIAEWLGIILVTVAGNVLSACVIEKWGSDGNPCSRAWEFLTTTKIKQLNIPQNGKARLVVSQQYHPGYIPGCEPRHSGPCNAGWWEVIFEKS